MYDFSSKRALVTGAGKGIGRAIAVALVNSGATTVALSRTQSDLDSLKAECPSIETVCVDLTEWGATKEAVSRVGPVDLLVNNAGVNILASFLEVKPEDFDTCFAVNVKSVINVSQIVAKSMIEKGTGGSIVNISSQASKIAIPDHSVYCATKGALDQLTRTMALELGPHQIRVNAVNPTVCLTDLGKAAWSAPAKRDPALARIPLRKFAELQDVVAPVMFLLSEGAAMVTGDTLMVDGGWTAN